MACTLQQLDLQPPFMNTDMQPMAAVFDAATPRKFPVWREQLAQELLGSCVVKHTFIEPPKAEEEKAGLQRSVSAPSLTSTPAEAPMKKPYAEEENAEEASTDDAGSEEGSDDSEETSSTSGSTHAHEGGEDSFEPVSHNRALIEALAAGAAAVQSTPGAMDFLDCQAQSLAQANGLLDYLLTPSTGSKPSRAAPEPPKGKDEVPPPPEPEPEQVRLKSSATPWRPMKSVFQEATRSIVASVMTCIQTLPMTKNAYIRSTRVGWNLRVHVREEDLPEVDGLLASAKSALLSAASVQGNVYPLGSLQDPFTDFHSGFRLWLGQMVNRDMACWDAFAGGNCTRRGCRWEHPARWDCIEVDVTTYRRY